MNQSSSLFRDGRFDGNLAQLIDLCMKFLPSPAILRAASLWVHSLEDEGKLLPIRKFAKRSKRGCSFQMDRKRFIPVDNETLADIYKLLLEGSVPFGDFLVLYRAKKLSVSWKLEVIDRDLTTAKRGQVSSSFRDQGLKLAHVLDAANALPQKTVQDYCVRYLRTINPLNCFPFPSSRKFQFKPVFGKKDPAEAPEIQAILAAVLRDYVGTEFNDFYKGVGGDFSKLPGNWRSLAQDIKVSFTERTKISPKAVLGDAFVGRLKKDKNGVIDSDVDAFSEYKMPPAKFEDLGSLIDALKVWRIQSPQAERLNGHRTFWSHKELKNVRSDPKTRCIFNLTASCLENVPADRQIAWEINGDSKVEAIDELIHLYENQESFDCIFEPELTKKGTRKLALKYQNGAAGFYCYE
jgi:hypothetical protein